MARPLTFAVIAPIGMTTKFLIGAFRCQNFNVRITYMEGKRYIASTASEYPLAKFVIGQIPSP